MNKISKPIFEGIATAIITPFKDNKVDFKSLERLIEIQISSGISAIIVCGTTGEASVLSEKEQLECIEFVLTKVNGKIPILAGTGSNNTEKAVSMTKAVSKMGVDGVLAITPYYNKASNNGLITHFEKIAEVSICPVIMYNVPSRTGMTIPIDVCKRLSENENIVGIKEASGNISYVANIAYECKDKIHIYSGNDDMILPVLSLGGKGAISVISNIIPNETQSIYQSFLSKDYEKSKETQLNILPMCKAMFCEVNPIPVKYALNLMGLCSEEIRLPLSAPNSNSKNIIKSILQAYDLI